MFKKDQDDHTTSTQPLVAPATAGRRQAVPHSGASAVIGPSITVKGDISGDEDLMILGRVQGTVNLAQHNVTIGPSGKVKADVLGKMVIVEGEVDGDLKAKEQIILRNTARVEGSISAPRVALADGADQDVTQRRLLEGLAEDIEDRTLQRLAFLLKFAEQFQVYLAFPGILGDEVP